MGSHLIWPTSPYLETWRSFQFSQQAEESPLFLVWFVILKYICESAILSNAEMMLLQIIYACPFWCSPECNSSTFLKHDLFILDLCRQAGHHELAERLVEIQYELTDRLTFYLCGRRPGLYPHRSRLLLCTRVVVVFFFLMMWLCLCCRSQNWPTLHHPTDGRQV